MMKIRQEQPGDEKSLYALNAAAFGQPKEAELVDALRANGNVAVSLVATEVAAGAEEIVGHIFFSPITIQSDTATHNAVALGPMAVQPVRQRCGIGTMLVEAGLDVCKAAGHPLVVVLGHPGFYPRFGFVPASRYGITSRYNVPDEVFMALELVEGAGNQHAGRVCYLAEFDNV